MGRLALGRMPAVNRRPMGFTNQATEQDKTYPAPIAGWVTNQSLLLQDKISARVMDNFFPTETGVTPRGGLSKFIDIPAKCEFLMEYNIGVTSSEYFAATETDIYKFTEGDSGSSITTAAVSSQTSSDYSYVNVVNSGGNYLKLVNGADDEQNGHGKLEYHQPFSEQ